MAWDPVFLERRRRHGSGLDEPKGAHVEMPVAGGYLALNKGGCRVPAKSARTKVLRRVTEVQGTLLTMQRAPEAAATTMALAALQLMAEPVTGYPLSGCLP